MTAPSTTEGVLEEAARALQAHETARARQLLREALRAEPANPRAWELAYAAAHTEQERAFCLRRWLALEPDHPVAHRLADTHSTKSPATMSPSAQSRQVYEWLAAPFAWLFHISPQALLLGGILLLLIGGWLAFQSNTVTAGHAMMLAETCDPAITELPCWQVTYERADTSTFAGKIRHISTIRERRFPMLSHDILITSGDFADPEKVWTSVANHRFVWRARTATYPQGKINLLHAVPASEELHQQLRQLRSGQEVLIEGHEILKIEVYAADGTHQGTWQDAGCNTLVITAVTLVDAHP